MKQKAHYRLLMYAKINCPLWLRIPCFQFDALLHILTDGRKELIKPLLDLLFK